MNEEERKLKENLLESITNRSGTTVIDVQVRINNIVEAFKLTNQDQNLSIQRLTAENAQLYKRLKDLENKILDLEKKLTERPETSNPQKLSTMDWSKILKEPGVKNQIIGIESREKKEIKRKEKNLIISNVPETTEAEDRDIVIEILKTTGVKIEEGEEILVRRLTRQVKEKRVVTNNLIVELKSVEERNKVLQQSKALKNIEKFREVYLNKDKTAAELQLEYEAREEVRLRNKDQNKTGKRYRAIESNIVIDKRERSQSEKETQENA